MKVSLKWLSEYVDVVAPVEELAHLLTMSGTEVGGIERHGDDWRGIVVGRIESVAPHPDAAALSLVTVKLGGPRATVVSGAPNLKAGDTVPFAQVGARVLDGHTGRPVVVQATVVRGVESGGVLCSEKELGLSDAHEGVLILSPDAPVGRPLEEVLGDAILDLEITPNRPDCLGVLGVAREVAALTEQPLRLPVLAYPEGDPDVARQARVEILAPDLCLRYLASVVRHIRIDRSPFWLRSRLIAAGVRPINNVVDVTNYVMLEYGQPLHAFDYEALAGRRIVVRRAERGEDVRTLDGVLRSLGPEVLVIADAERPVAIAGVMGGLGSEVTDRTRTVLLESATFDRVSIRRACRALKLRTESSARFDKGLPPAIAATAVRRATALLTQVCGGEAARGVLDVYPAPRAAPEVTVTAAELRRTLGVELTVAQVRSVLERLGFECREEGRALVARPPEHRTDIRIPADLAEEVARLIGYDRIPTTAMAGPLPAASPQPMYALAERIRDLLVACGLQEVITYSLVGRRLLDKASRASGESGAGSLGLANPLTPDQTLLRTSLLPSLLESVAGNLRPDEAGPRLFEVGRVYLPRDGDLPHERETLGLAMAGPRGRKRWGEPVGDLDLFDLKGVVEELLERLQLSGARFERWRDDRVFHPGRAAAIEWAGTRLGVMGEAHPAVARDFEVRVPVFLAELDLERVLPLVEGRLLEVRPPPRFPAVRRDLAVVVDEGVSTAELLEAIREAGAPLLASAEPFDLFRGPGVPPGRKSCAFSLVFRSPERTLTDAEVADVEARILEQVGRRTGARLRG
jgi:phenylalanyl-tRNA synthetase beta chain